MELRSRQNQNIGSTTMISPDDESSNTEIVGKEKIKVKSSSRRFYFVTIFCLCMSLVVTIIYPRTLDRLLGVVWSARHYAIILDCGSTGSRLLAFTFRRGTIDQQLQLVDELWLEVKPGLSSYAGDPNNAAASISKLLQSAKEQIPEEHWAHTPITLKATAGLRLLPVEQAQAIIEEVEKVLIFSGFKQEKTLVEIMNPRDEGLYAWFTVNFLLDIFSNDLIDNFVSLDLGGGSTQITFVPSKYPVDGLEGRKHFLHNVTILGNRHIVYTHSYLGLGLMAARQAIFTQVGEYPDGQISSACMASTIPQEWSFHGKDYVISSSPGKGTSYESCREVVRQVIAAQNVHVPSEILSRNVAAFSYFYDRALDNGLLVPGQFEGRATIQSYIDAAKVACNVASHENTAFQCIDLTYIVSLLADGYGLPLDKELHLFKKINGHEASWALGVAYSIVFSQ